MKQDKDGILKFKTKIHISQGKKEKSNSSKYVINFAGKGNTVFNSVSGINTLTFEEKQSPYLIPTDW